MAELDRKLRRVIFNNSLMYGPLLSLTIDGQAFIQPDDGSLALRPESVEI
jgi:hypothetical protein